MLKRYKLPNGRTYLFEEGKAPAGAVLKESKPARKGRKPSNKSRKTENKSSEA